MKYKIDYRILLALLLTMVISSLYSQEYPLSNKSATWFLIKDPVITIDTLTIDPSTCILLYQNDTIPSSEYTIENAKTVRLSPEAFKKFKNDSLLIVYRHLPFDLNASYSHLDSSQIRSKDRAIYIGYDYTPYDQSTTTELFAPGLIYDGSFSRGISFGNSQSLVLNSSLNLQLSGDLGNDLLIQAAISDENIPIQPEGNTQLIQEFDKVFIKVNKKDNEIIAGDYESKNPAGHFMRYFKKLKGIKVGNKSSFGPNNKIVSSGNFAVSRGKFARNFLEVQEGNQGPYKLQGNNGEVFFFVLAGTEKVYIDGNLLERGLERDYIIDYNLAEIQFTAKQLITKDKRVIVEFEYTDQNYNRTQYGINSIIENEKWNFGFAFYSEQDNKGSTSNLELDSLDIAILEASGDDLTQSLRSGIRIAEDTDLIDRVKYEKVFEISIQDSILVYAEDQENALYVASFSDIGPGNGSYAIDNLASANGRVYKWVGIGNGRYEPIIRLIAPEQQQMLALGGTYKLSKNSRISAELALTNFDLNRFSSSGNDDNQGIATNLELNHGFEFGNTNQTWLLDVFGKYEFAQANFSPLNPYRNTEFERDWDFDENIRSNENLASFGANLKKGEQLDFSYSFNGLGRSEFYDGTRQASRLKINEKGFEVLVEGSFLNADDPNARIHFFRPKVRISQRLGFLRNTVVGAYAEQEENKRTLTAADSLSKSSFAYDYYRIYLQSAANQKIGWNIQYNRRIDKSPVISEFEKASQANEVQFNGNWNNGSQGRLSLDFSYRDLQVLNSNLTTLQPQKTYLGKLDFDYNFFDGAIRTNSSFGISSGQEAKLEYTFEEVQEGRGDFIWIDIDSNGVQTINEFQPAPFADEANFIRVRIFNNEFISTNNSGLSQSFRIEPRNFWKNKEGIKSDLQKFISRFSLVSNFRIDQKLLDEDGGRSFSPLKFDIQDTSLVSFNSSLNSTLFFNRGNPRYDLQVNLRNNKNRFNQITGAELRLLDELNFRARLNLETTLDLIFKSSVGTNEQDSELFEGNIFKIDFWNLSPEMNWRPNNRMRFVFNYAFNHKQNDLGPEKATAHALEVEYTLRQANSSRINAGIEYNRIAYNGVVNNTLELAMLEGLKDGNNILWNINMTRRIANNLDMIIDYEGRKTGDSRTVHVARAQIKASF